MSLRTKIGNLSNILDEDGSNIVLQYSICSQIFEPLSIQLETGTGIGILLSETSVYDIDGNIVTDYALLHENTDGYPDVLGAPETRNFGNGGLSKSGAFRKNHR